MSIAALLFKYVKHSKKSSRSCVIRKHELELWEPTGQCDSANRLVIKSWVIWRGAALFFTNFEPKLVTQFSLSKILSNSFKYWVLGLKKVGLLKRTSFGALYRTRKYSGETETVIKIPSNKETAWFVTVKVDLSHVGVRSRLVFEQLIQNNVTST